jgi:acyl-CoA reductase-like NAD-dependent aldehyde dehydrogenase
MTQAVLTSPTLSVHSPYDRRLIGQVQIPDQATVERAVAAAHNCRAELAALPAHRRASALALAFH